MLTGPSRSRVPGPLEPFAVGFARELERQGYTRSSAQPQVHLMARLNRWLEDKGLDVHELCATEVERFVGARRAEAYKKYLTSKALGPVLDPSARATSGANAASTSARRTGGGGARALPALPHG